MVNSGGRSKNKNPTTPTRGVGKVPVTQSASSSETIPSPPPPIVRVNITSPSSGSKRPLSPKKSSVICPICFKDMYHYKALNGHIRWHTEEERQAKKRDLKDIRDRDAAAAVVPAVSVPEVIFSEVVQQEEKEEASSSFVVPDLNLTPPDEDE